MEMEVPALKEHQLWHSFTSSGLKLLLGDLVDPNQESN